MLQLMFISPCNDIGLCALSTRQSHLKGVINIHDPGKRLYRSSNNIEQRGPDLLVIIIYGFFMNTERLDKKYPRMTITIVTELKIGMAGPSLLHASL